MTWTYSGDPSSSSKDEVRFHVQDTDENLQLLTDEEINFLLTKYGTVTDSVIYIAHLAALAISRKFAGVVSISGDGVSVNLADLSTRYESIAKQLYDEYEENTLGSVDILNIMIGVDPDPSIRPLKFGMNLMDNPEAGQQDYGTVLPIRLEYPELTDRG